MFHLFTRIKNHSMLFFMLDFLKIVYFSYRFIFYFYFYIICSVSLFLLHSLSLFSLTFLFFLLSIFYLFPQTKNFSLSFFPLCLAKIFSFLSSPLVLFFSCIHITFYPFFPFSSPIICHFTPLFPHLVVSSFFLCILFHFHLFYISFYGLPFSFCYCLCSLCCFTFVFTVLYHIFSTAILFIVFILLFVSLSIFHLFP